MPPSPPLPDDAIPRAFTFEQLRFKQVEVMADGILYRGMLIGADEYDLFIKGRLRWLILPLDKITSVRLEGEMDTFDPHKSVDAGFYRQENDESDG